MTSFLIELRSSGYPEQLESKLQYVAEGWCRARETRASCRRTPLRTRRGSAQPCYVVRGQSGWASGGTELPRHDLRLKSSLDPVEAEELGVDDFDVGSTSHAHAVSNSLTHRNGPNSQMGAIADGYGAGTMAGEQWGYGRGL
ncbi:hypothetical protein B0H14DRAFT_3428706 [Mycena olivaceomarginata]|nr:hypothetical protein B0H14DRAFT_3428706 [Mycena olivaceomarginata]